MGLIYRCRATIYDPAAVANKTLYTCTGLGYRTGPADTPANQVYVPCIQQPASLQRDAWDTGTTGGASRQAYGNLVHVGADGQLDAWVAYIFAGWPFEIDMGDETAGNGAFTTVFKGSQGLMTWDQKRFTTPISDRLSDLDRPFMPATFFGTNSGATGIEGLTSDLGGKAPTMAYGGSVAGPVDNVTPQQVNTSLKIYALNWVGALSRSTVAVANGARTFVLDRDVPFTAGNYCSALADASNYVIGTVTSYTPATKTLVMSVTTAVGGGSASQWQVKGTRAVAGIPAVRDRESALTFSGTDRATLALLQAAVISAGFYDTCLAEGLFRVGGTVYNAVTCDWYENTSTMAQIAKAAIIGPGGFGTADVSAADVAALDTANSDPVALWVEPGMTIKAGIDKVMASDSCYFGPDQFGVYRMGQLVAPVGSPVATFTQNNVISITQLGTNDASRGVPLWRNWSNYRENHTVQQLAAILNTVADSRAQFAEDQWRQSLPADDLAVKATYPNADLQGFDTCFTTATGANNAATRRKGFYGAPQVRYQIKLRLDDVNGPGIIAAVTMASVVTLAFPRFGLDAGKLFTILGIGLDLRLWALVLTLWRPN